MADQEKDVMSEKINPNHPEGAKEVAELLTFLPEEQREMMVNTFAKNMLQM